jgi:hypothetical protein
VLDEIEGFDWDKANVDHILRHDVTLIEVEEITGGTYVINPGENRQTREAMEAVWQNAIRAIPGRRVHHSPETVPHRDCL